MFYNARYYDPAIGRFISADTIVPDPSNPQDLNRYSYVRNNPTNYTDPSGHCASPTTPTTRDAGGWISSGCPFAVPDAMIIIIDTGTTVLSSAVSTGFTLDWKLVKAGMDQNLIEDIVAARQRIGRGKAAGPAATALFVVIDGAVIEMTASQIGDYVLAGGGSAELAVDGQWYFRAREWTGIGGGLLVAGGVMAFTAKCIPVAPYACGTLTLVAGGVGYAFGDWGAKRIYDHLWFDPLLEALVADAIGESRYDDRRTSPGSRPAGGGAGGGPVHTL